MARRTETREPASARANFSDGDLFFVKARKSVPHEFVLEALEPVSPWTRPMFGCTAIYVGEKIVLILRQKPSYERDNGVWLATAHEHHESLREDFPNMRSIELLGEPVSNWQILPIDAPCFEESAMRACELVIAGDPRIGRVPKSRKPKQGKKAAKPSKKAAKPRRNSSGAKSKRATRR